LKKGAWGERAAAGLGVLLSVALEVKFHTLRQEALASGGTAAAQDVAAIGRFLAGTESKLLLARALGGLVGSKRLRHGRVGW